jgi:hypothetical protein
MSFYFLLPMLVSVAAWYIYERYYGPGQHFAPRTNEKKSRRVSWERLAMVESLGLTLGFGNKGLYATKKFAGHNFHLESFQKGEDIYSRITLVSEQPLTRPAQSTFNLTDAMIEDALFGPAIYEVLTGRLEADPRAGLIWYEQLDSDMSEEHYQAAFKLLVQLGAAYPALVDRGGEGAVRLEEIAARNITPRPLIYALLKDIGRDTEARLGHQVDRLWCPRCLARFSSHQVRFANGFFANTVTYIGCRLCGQSQAYHLGQVAAILDSQTDQAISESIGLVRVNWLALKQPFDFDRVEIRRASDEDVERFVMQIGNDTDSFRRPRYKTLRCVVSGENRLSENSLRLLRRAFGEVSVG